MLFSSTSITEQKGQIILYLASGFKKVQMATMTVWYSAVNSLFFPKVVKILVKNWHSKSEFLVCNILKVRLKRLSPISLKNWMSPDVQRKRQMFSKLLLLLFKVSLIHIFQFSKEKNQFFFVQIWQIWRIRIRLNTKFKRVRKPLPMISKRVQV